MTMQVRIWLSLLLTLLLGYTSYSAWRWYERGAQATSSGQPRHLERNRPTGSLAGSELVDTQGQAFDLDSLKGKVWLASFFFSSCPGPCAQMNRAIAGLQNEQKDENLKFVSITVDPANDTPEVLAAYARNFHADPQRWTFLSGPFEKVVRLAESAFQVNVGPKMHTERVILVDKASNVRGMYTTSDPTQMLALNRKIKQLLAETPGEASAHAASVADEPAVGEASANAESLATESSNIEPANAEAGASAATEQPIATPDEPTAEARP